MNRVANQIHAGLSAVGRALAPPRPFEPAAVERAFLADYATQCAGRRRISGALALVIWASFCAFDVWVGGPNLARSLALRIAGTAVFAASLALSFHPLFLREDLAERVIAVPALLCYGLLLAMIVNVDSGGDYLSDDMGLLVYISFVSGSSTPTWSAPCRRRAGEDRRPHPRRAPRPRLGDRARRAVPGR